ncbi:hypothetical protein NDU88_003536 [Pleurodeles waltl]|uniref:Uncharacterized protein n=1 Tax=Pleurodeles waltl TaxID=8319 RepID=A0AAV7UCR6_PLEWA|nr:hypothetical protein NDU88_003536 [Pleurodeles waltl]
MAPSTSAATSRPPNVQGQSSWGGARSRSPRQAQPAKHLHLSGAPANLRSRALTLPSPHSGASAILQGLRLRSPPSEGAARSGPTTRLGPLPGALGGLWPPLAALWAAAPLPVAGGLRPSPPPGRASVFWGHAPPLM